MSRIALTACLLVVVAAAGCGSQSGSGAERNIDPADQRWSEGQLLRLPDLSTGWDASPPDKDDSDSGCDNIRASGLALTGDQRGRALVTVMVVAPEGSAAFGLRSELTRLSDERIREKPPPKR